MKSVAKEVDEEEGGKLKSFGLVWFLLWKLGSIWGDGNKTHSRSNLAAPKFNGKKLI